MPSMAKRGKSLSFFCFSPLTRGKLRVKILAHGGQEVEKFELKFKRGDKKAFLKKLFDLPLSKGITSGSLVGLLEGFFQAVAVPQLDPENKFEDALCPVIVNLVSTNDQVLSKDTLGGYNVEDKEIFILDRRDIDGSDLPLSIASMFGTLAHEYRHHIQHIKGSKQAEEMFWKLYKFVMCCYYELRL